MRDEMTDSQSAPLSTDVRDMVVRLILTREVPRAQLARELGIGLPTLTRWVREVIDHSPFGDVLKSLHDEVGTLRKENSALQQMLFARAARAGAESAE